MNLSEQLMVQNRDARSSGAELGGSFWRGVAEGQQEALTAPTRRLQQDLLGLQVGAAREAETVNQQLHKDIPGIVQAFGDIPVDDSNGRHAFIAQHAGLAVTPMGKALLAQLSDTADSMDEVYSRSIGRQKQLLQVKDDLEAYQLGMDLTDPVQREKFYARRQSIDVLKQEKMKADVDLLEARATAAEAKKSAAGVDPMLERIFKSAEAEGNPFSPEQKQQARLVALGLNPRPSGNDILTDQEIFFKLLGSKDDLGNTIGPEKAAELTKQAVNLLKKMAPLNSTVSPKTGFESLRAPAQFRYDPKSGTFTELKP